MTTTFVLTGSREALRHYTGAAHFEQQIVALEAAVPVNAGLAIDLSKTLVESVCKTILHDCGQTPNEKDSLGKLLKQVMACLQLVPASFEADDKAKEGLQKTAGGLATVIQGLSQLRNSAGFASHGKDAFAEQLDTTQAEFAARAADSVVRFLLNLHQGSGPHASRAPLRYGDRTDYDDFLDDTHDEIELLGNPYRASELLYWVDLEAYRNGLASFDADGGAP